MGSGGRRTSCGGLWRWRRPTQPSTPQAPSGLAAATVSASEIALSWTDNSGNEDGFRIERCTGAGCTSFSAVGTAGAGATSYHSTGLDPSTMYAYRVQAFNAGGASSYSNTAR